MKVINKGSNYAKVFTDNIEQSATEQIETYLTLPKVKNQRIRIMPDVHAGMGCVIGFTAELTDFIIPNMIGVDIGCGVLTVKFKSDNIDLEKLDNFIKVNIPCGFNIHNLPKVSNMYIRESDTCKQIGYNEERLYRSLGTLGGGNHFIELGFLNDYYYLTIHTGSRNFGNEIAKYYQGKAKQMMSDLCISVPNNLEYLVKGYPYFDEYLRDLEVAQMFAGLNRDKIKDNILEFLKISDDNILEEIESIHNFVGFGDNIIRKGAISARENEDVVIPFNMRDGLLIGVGLGNKDWNYSAPHGAGRISSRTQAKKDLQLEDFKKTMEGIYSSTVCDETLDEAPMCYKPAQEIIDAIKETVLIKEIVKPIYNFKATK